MTTTHFNSKTTTGGAREMTTQPTWIARTALAGICCLVLGLAATAQASRVVVDSFGSSGSADGQFGSTGGAAIDEDTGDVYVVDTGNSRVERFDADGNFISAFGVPGAGNGELSSPNQIAIDNTGGANDGAVYVADTANNRIQRFSASGVYESQFGTAGAGDGELASPEGVAVAPDGSVYVADTANNRIQKFTAAGAYDSQFGVAGFGDGEFSSPGRVAVASTGDVYVLERFSRVQKFDSTGAFVEVFAPGVLFRAPQELAIDPINDHVHVAQFAPDFSNVEVDELDSSGSQVDAHGANSDMQSPSGLAATTGERLYVPAFNGSFEPRVHILVMVDPPTATLDPVADPAAFEADVTGEVNPNGSATTYHFEYSADGSDWKSTADKSAGDGSSPIAVQGTVHHLQANAHYFVRLVATNVGGSTTTGPPEELDTDPAPPTVHTGYPGVGVTTATLAGQVNPNNESTTHYFEYATQPDFSDAASLPVSEDADAGSDGVSHTFTAPITGLTAGTTYRYRIVATNSQGTTEGTVRSFTTKAALPTPPTDRAYEKVSPDDKGGFGIAPRGLRGSSPDGNRITFASAGGAAAGDPNGGWTVFLGARDPDAGWSSEVIDPPPGATGDDYPTFSDDLSHGVLMSPAALAPGALSQSTQLYLRDNATSSFELLTPSGFPPSPLATFLPIPRIGDVSADYRRILYQAPVAQTGDAVTGAYNTYLWADGEVRLVGILPNGEIPSDGSVAGSSASAGTSVGSLSGDGRRAIFHAVDLATVPGAETSAAGQLYVRDDHGTPALDDDTTVQLSASQRTDCADDPSCGGDGEPDPAPDPHGPLPALYLAAEAEHASSVLFMSCERLTDDSSARFVDQSDSNGNCHRGEQPTGFPRGRDLYRYDVDSGELRDLTTADPDGTDLYGIVGASDDLEHIYFVAGGALAPGAARGKPNLYLWDAGATTFIGTLDEAVSQGGGAVSDSDAWRLLHAAHMRMSRISADGGHLLLTSRAPLTGADNVDTANCPSSFAHRCSQVYLYDADADQLTCVSCPAEGQRPAGDATLTNGEGVAMAGSPDPLARNLAADGSFAFFETPQKLVGRDSNARTDVYRWHGGEVELISSGASSSESHFADATSSGDDVFFTTNEPLVARDRDQARDLYDARVGGGFPEPPPPVPACQSDACQGTPSGRPGLAAPDTDRLQGRGDVSLGTRRSFSLLALSVQARRRAARTGVIPLRVRSSRAGRLTAVARGRVDGRVRRVGSASRRLTRPSTVTLQVRLSPAALDGLRARSRMALRIVVRSAGAGSRSLSLVLRRAK